MSRIEWLETFSLDVPEIDGDHRVLLQLINLAKTAAEVADRERCAQYLDRLLAFVRLHFAREEALLETWGIPDADEHAKYHRELIEKILGVKKTCMSVDGRNAFEECCSELAAFIVDEIVRGDLQLKSHLDNAGLALRG